MIRRYSFNEILMPDSVRCTIDQWSKQEKKNVRIKACNSNRHNKPLEWGKENKILIDDSTAKLEPGV